MVTNNLYIFRKKAKLSLRELGKKSGISYSYLDRIENGLVGRVSVKAALKISKALNVSVENIFHLKEDNHMIINLENYRKNRKAFTPGEFAFYYSLLGYDDQVIISEAMLEYIDTGDFEKLIEALKRSK